MRASAFLRPVCLFGLTLLVTGCAAENKASGSSPSDVQVGAPGAATCSTTTSAEQVAGVRATNAVRAQAGLPAVRANSLLAQAAALHACDMAERGRMTHGGSRSSGPAQRVKGVGYRPSVTAENIAAGPFGLERVLAEWTASPGHVSNIMIPQLREFGIGQATASDGRTRYWAAVYSAPQGR